jgi:hypothetical protein
MKQKNSGSAVAADAPVRLKKRLVTTPRSKAPKVQMNFKMDARRAALVEARAPQLHKSKTELIVGAIDRCLQDDVWKRGTRPGAKHRQTLNPPPELVELSNILVELAFVVNLMSTKRKTKAVKDQANRIYLDAVLRLQNVRQDLGC